MNTALFDALRNALSSFIDEVCVPDADKAGFGVERVISSGGDFIAGFCTGVNTALEGQSTVQDALEFEARIMADIQGIRTDLEARELARRKMAGLPCSERMEIRYERCNCGEPDCRGGSILLRGPCGDAIVTAAVLSAVGSLCRDVGGSISGDASCAQDGQPTRWERHTLTLTVEPIDPDKA